MTPGPSSVPPTAPAANAHFDRSANATRAREIADALTGVAALTGATLPDEERMAPRVSVHLTRNQLARTVGQLVQSRPIFRRVPAGDVVTVDPRTGEERAMPALRFASWLENVITFTKATRGGDVVSSLPVEAAAGILAADAFLDTLRPLKTVHSVRLPAWTADGKAVTLMRAGYDEGTCAFTVDTLPCDENMDVDAARRFFLETFAEFPFARPDSDPSQPLEKNRSLAVQIAAMLAVYCRPLLRGLRPAIAYQANQPGSGKTLLLRMALAPVFGGSAIQSAPRDENELGKQLTATAIDALPYIVMDNLSGYFASSELESFLTSPRRRGRWLGKSEMREADNTANVFITGNGLTISNDLARRCLLCDLWYAGEVEARTIKNPIEEDAICTAEARATFLSALWALVRYWSDRGCPRSTGARLASFETFSSIIGGIVMTAMFADPIARPEVRLDEKQLAWQALFKSLAETVDDGATREFNLDEIMEQAKDSDLLEILVGNAKNPKVSLGMSLKQFRGRHFTDPTGRLFEFGHRKADAGARYKVRMIPPPDANTPA